MILPRWSRAPPPAEIPIVAVDLPSGVATDTGQAPAGSVQATRTVTFGVLQALPPDRAGGQPSGEVEVVDIGLDPSHTVPALAPGKPPTWRRTGRCRARPVTSTPAGWSGSTPAPTTYPGAGVLSTFGAVYGGAGMVRFLGASGSAEIIGRELPNVVFGEGRVQAWLVGSGWGDRADGDDVIAGLVDGRDCRW